MELRHLRYFVAVAEELNFSRAAKRLHIAQPPLSQSIQGLEEELKVKLFDRSKRPLQLTPAGQIFLDETRLIIERLFQAKNLTQRVERGEIGRLTVGFTSSIANSILPDILRSFRQQHPNVELVWCELATEIQIRSLRDRQIDLGLCHLPNEAIEYDDLSFMTILEEPLILALPEHHPLASEAQIPLHILAAEEFVLPVRQVVSGLSEQIYLLCHQAGFIPKVTQEATFMLTILSLVAGGVGIALLPANAKNLRRKGVVYRTIQGQTATIKMAAVWRHNDRSVILSNFLENLKIVINN